MAKRITEHVSYRYSLAIKIRRLQRRHPGSNLDADILFTIDTKNFVVKYEQSSKTNMRNNTSIFYPILIRFISLVILKMRI